MKIIEKLIIVILLVSTFLPHIWGSILIQTNKVSPIIYWIIHRINAIFVGFLLLIAVGISLVLFKKNKNLISGFHLNILDISVLILCFGIGGFSAIIGLIRSNSINYLIGDTYIYFSFGIVYFLAACCVRKEGILKIIDFFVYFVFFFMMIPETIYRLIGYFLTNSYPFGGSIYYFLPFLYFFNKYLSTHSKKSLIALIITILCIVLSVYRTLGMILVFIILLSPLLTLRFKRTHLKIAGVFLVFMILALILYFADILPIFQRYDLSQYYQFYFGINRGQEARTLEVVSAINTMKGNILNYFWGMGQGAVAEMIGGEQYETIYTIDGEGLFFGEEGLVHSIHFTPGSVFFRTGVLGLISLFTFLFLTLLFLYKKLSLVKSFPDKIYVETIFLFFFAILIYSFSRYSIINDLVLATFIGFIRNPHFK